MPSEADRLLERARRSSAGWRRQEIDRLYQGFGFRIRQGSNHDVVTHPDFLGNLELRGTLPRHSEIAKEYVRAAVKHIEKLKQLQAERGRE